MMLGVKEHSWGFVQGESTLAVVDSWEELRDKVPAEFFDLVSAAATQPPVHDLPSAGSREHRSRTLPV